MSTWVTVGTGAYSAEPVMLNFIHAAKYQHEGLRNRQIWSGADSQFTITSKLNAGVWHVSI